MSRNEDPSFIAQMVSSARACPHKNKGKCSHPEWLLSDGQPWIDCLGVKELKNGCPESFIA